MYAMLQTNVQCHLAEPRMEGHPEALLHVSAFEVLHMHRC